MTDVTQLRDNLWLTYVDLGDEDVKGAVILGSRRAVVWDTLSHPQDMEAVQPLIADRPFHVVYTHADYDHCWGTNGLPDVPGEIIAHKSCAQRFRTDVPKTLKAKQNKAQHWHAVELMPPTLTFEKYISLDLGDITLELHHLSGHTPDCIVGFIPQWGVLLAGDTVETPLPLINEDSPVNTWLDHLRQWADDERVQTVVLAHGDVGNRDTIQHNIDYLSRLAARQPVEVPDDLPPFYQRAHQRNQKRSQQI